MLLGGLAIALVVVFAKPLQYLLDLARDVEQSSGLTLVPALITLAVAFLFHQQSKRQEAKAHAAAAEAEAFEAEARAAEMERLVTFGQALGRSLDIEAICNVVVQHLPKLTGSDEAWAMTRFDGHWLRATRRRDGRGLMSPGRNSLQARRRREPRHFFDFIYVLLGSPKGGQYVVLIAWLGLLVPLPVAAQQAPESQAAQPNEHRAADVVKFLAGGALAFGTHEVGHLFFDATFDAGARLKRVEFGIPFFAIVHRGDLSPRREFTISSAGFWVQEGTSEWLLTRRPQLRHEHASLAKGVLAFNVLASVAYSSAAFAKAGPHERDTLGMADAIDVDERAIGAVVLVPAIFDAYRYFRPESRWAKWASRIAKAGSVLLILK